MRTNIVDDINIEILFEDKNLMVCVKPAGMPSQPDLNGGQSLLSFLERRYPEVRLVHRLDTMTGGVMVFAKNPNAASALSSLIQDHTRFIKKYLAVTEKCPAEKEGILEDYLFHDRRTNKTEVVPSGTKEAKAAKLSYRVLAEKENFTLSLITLMTGRSHQIRAQFSSRGCPVYGDGKYGGRERMTGFALWSYGVEFVHPMTGKKIVCYALPDRKAVPWNLFEDEEYC